MLSVAMDMSTMVMVLQPSIAPTDAQVQIATETRTLNRDYGAVLVVGYSTACSVLFGTSD